MDRSTARAVTEASRLYFAEALPSEDFEAWLAVTDGQVVGSGMVVYISRPPRRNSLDGRDAYLLGMFTAPDWRRKGIGTAILNEIISSVKQTEAHCIFLYSLDKGRGIYEKAGFESRSDIMQLTW